MIGQLRNNPAVKVNVDDYRDMMFVMVEIQAADMDIEHCCYCQRELGVCECIPGEKSILLDDENYVVVDAEFEPVS